MEQEIKDRWVHALRSGAYKQTPSVLHRLEGDPERPAGYCCLGVLCDLFVKDGQINSHVVSGAEHFGASAAAVSLPHEVYSACGFTSDMPTVPVEAKDKLRVLDMTMHLPQVKTMDLIGHFAGNEEVSLAYMNDCNVPFGIIADLISKYL